MCTNYRPTSRELAEEYFGVIAGFDFPDETYPCYAAPIIRAAHDGNGRRDCLAACFGLIPAWSKDTKIARQTTNARSETVAEKPSYRTPWRSAQLCLVPMLSFYEPCYESGKAVRWRIGRADGAPFAAAGLWSRWVAPPTGEVVHSFTLLTVNADGHPVMQRFHRPEDEKRSIVIVPRERYDDWLRADASAARGFLHAPAPDLLAATADPRPVATRRKDVSA